MRSPRRHAWLAIALAGSALLVWRTRDFGLLGLDTLPSIETSRFESWRQLVDLFGQRLMTTHNFYRPLLAVSIGTDHALHGLEARGYQLTSAAFFALCSLALGLVLRRLLGERAWVGPAFGVAAFVLFPRHLDVVPVVPRRGELMVGAFTLLALASQLAPRNLERGLPPLAPALWMLLAMASKDTGLVLWPLCPLAVLLCSSRTGGRARLAHALRAALPHAIVFAAFLALRTHVLGGIGGNQELTRFKNLGALPAMLGSSLARVLRPEHGEASAAGMVLAVGVAASCIALALLGVQRAPVSREARRRACVQGLALGLAWLLLLVGAYSLRGVWQPWYAFLLGLAGALALGALVELACSLGRAPASPATRVTARVAIAFLLASLAHRATRSPVLRPAPDWERETAAVEGFYEELARRIDAATPGSSVQVPALDDSRIPGVASGVLDVGPSTVRAWLRLTRPERSLRLVVNRKRPKVRAHEIVLVYWVS